MAAHSVPASWRHSRTSPRESCNNTPQAFQRALSGATTRFQRLLDYEAANVLGSNQIQLCTLAKQAAEKLAVEILVGDEPQHRAGCLRGASSAKSKPRQFELRNDEFFR